MKNTNDGRAALTRFGDQFDNDIAIGGVKRCGGFVEKENGRRINSRCPRQQV
jgi:hypothetical protein